MRVLDLFSGIGGFSLGLERAGMKTVAQCEIDPFCRAVLKRHWKVPIYEDVRELTAGVLERDGIAVDVICGGFPCQDISFAGAGVGINGERSGLWVEVLRTIREIRPKYAILENVAALLGRGLGDILAALSSIGYDAEWHCIPASYVGAPHIRDRVWIVAYPAVSDDNGEGTFSRFGRFQGGILQARRHLPSDWPAEPRIPRVVDGLPDRAQRARALGNAVVPAVVELIGRAIMQAEAA